MLPTTTRALSGRDDGASAWRMSGTPKAFGSGARRAETNRRPECEPSPVNVSAWSVARATESALFASASSSTFDAETFAAAAAAAAARDSGRIRSDDGMVSGAARARRCTTPSPSATDAVASEHRLSSSASPAFPVPFPFARESSSAGSSRGGKATLIAVVDVGIATGTSDAAKVHRPTEMTARTGPAASRSARRTDCGSPQDAGGDRLPEPRFPEPRSPSPSPFCDVRFEKFQTTCAISVRDASARAAPSAFGSPPHARWSAHAHATSAPADFGASTRARTSPDGTATTRAPSGLRMATAGWVGHARIWRSARAADRASPDRVGSGGIARTPSTLSRPLASRRTTAHAAR